jgi:hypothetical protein
LAEADAEIADGDVEEIVLQFLARSRERGRTEEGGRRATSLHAKDDVGAQLAGEHGRRSSRRGLARVQDS